MNGGTVPELYFIINKLEDREIDTASIALHADTVDLDQRLIMGQ